MLISHPSIMFRQHAWLTNFEQFCCFLAGLFPKVFYTSLLTWSLYVLIFVASNKYIWTDYGHRSLAIAIDIVGIVTYLFSIYTYYKVIHVGPGSPLDYPELIIRNLESLNRPSQTTYQSANPFDTTTSTMSEAESQMLMNGTESSDCPEPESPPAQFLEIHTINSPSSYRYCSKCSVWKPDRTHHCSATGKCVLRMDHYCPWFSTTVGFFNQKFFIQFLVYLTIHSFYLCIVSSAILWKFLASSAYEEEFISINVVALFVLSLAFGIALACFSGLQIYFLLLNMTTIEFQDFRWSSMRKIGGSFQYDFDSTGKQKALGHIYDLGYYKNFTSIMGHTWKDWLLPLTVTSHSIEDKYNNGINYEINEEEYERRCSSARLQDQLNEQLAEYKRRARQQREEEV
ncbi:predicted protein [Scheffersomyces stipitis CBS 6054]|uniref:Palmitoyltransferase n=1 Tax=Scheffersomyces stipitis (strain ATCC 58785 / CBS 6054 / NBRC 10063 / NRRL Y-11545) TaxID=322104 RepID=A3GHM6_PICST|nr:predicted protein [Scheffersomyces stipitis CBS 6054]EAZ62849.2 predicted protein [Scheffersomyces stipitis CBS 6054]